MTLTRRGRVALRVALGLLVVLLLLAWGRIDTAACAPGQPSWAPGDGTVICAVTP